LPAPRKYPDELRERAVPLYRESSPRPTFRRLEHQFAALSDVLFPAREPTAAGGQR